MLLSSLLMYEDALKWSSLVMNRPQSLLTGMNKFLASLEVTFRRDPTNYRPRVNKLNSVKDREQKGMSIAFYFGCR